MMEIAISCNTDSVCIIDADFFNLSSPSEESSLFERLNKPIYCISFVNPKKNIQLMLQAEKEYSNHKNQKNAS